MKKLFFIVSLIGCLASCSKEGAISSGDNIIGEWELTRVELYETKDGKTELTYSLEITNPYEDENGAAWDYLKVDTNIIECIDYDIDDDNEPHSWHDFFTYSISGNKITFFTNIGYAYINSTIEKLSKNELVLSAFYIDDEASPVQIETGKAYYKRVK